MSPNPALLNTPSVHGQKKRKTSTSQPEGDYEHPQLLLVETFFLVFAIESVTEAASVETAVIGAQS